jgi:TRAP-type C4-dicarboxylate transport system permease small subunit
MVSRLGMIIAGLGLLYSAWTQYARPLAANAPERGGWLYQHFGQTGLWAGSAIIGLFVLIIGIIMTARMINRIRAARKGDRDAQAAVYSDMA